MTEERERLAERMDDHAAAARAAAGNPPGPTTARGWLDAAKDFSDAAAALRTPAPALSEEEIARVLWTAEFPDSEVPKNLNISVAEGYLVMARAILSRLAAPAVPAVPGWKLAPVEPTEEMRLAGMRAMDAQLAEQTSVPSLKLARVAYEAMLAASPPAQAESREDKPNENDMTEAQIKYMVNRFLAWKLPRDNFNPDCGISFDKEMFNTHTAHPMKHEPSGTNLFDAAQAEAMVRHMIEGIPRTESREDTWNAALEKAAEVANKYGQSFGWRLAPMIRALKSEKAK